MAFRVRPSRRKDTGSSASNLAAQDPEGIASAVLFCSPEIRG